MRRNPTASNRNSKDLIIPCAQTSKLLFTAQRSWIDPIASILILYLSLLHFSIGFNGPQFTVYPFLPVHSAFTTRRLTPRSCSSHSVCDGHVILGHPSLFWSGFTSRNSFIFVFSSALLARPNQYSSFIHPGKGLYFQISSDRLFT